MSPRHSWHYLFDFMKEDGENRRAKSFDSTIGRCQRVTTKMNRQFDDGFEIFQETGDGRRSTNERTNERVREADERTVVLRLTMKSSRLINRHGTLRLVQNSTRCIWQCRFVKAVAEERREEKRRERKESKHHVMCTNPRITSTDAARPIGAERNTNEQTCISSFL